MGVAVRVPSWFSSNVLVEGDVAVKLQWFAYDSQRLLLMLIFVCIHVKYFLPVRIFVKINISHVENNLCTSGGGNLFYCDDEQMVKYDHLIIVVEFNGDSCNVFHLTWCKF